MEAADPDRDVVAQEWARFGQVNGRAMKIAEATAQQIVHDIVEQGLEPGARLAQEAEMLEQYGLSRASLREALRILEVQGLITLKPGPGGGPTVGHVDARNFARTAALYFHLGGMTYGQLFEVQALLESSCAAQAARHGDAATKREAFAPFVESGAPMPESDFRARAVQFHDLIFEFSGNDVLTLLTKSVAHIAVTHVVSTMEPVDLHDRIVGNHQRIATAIVAGDAAAAQEAMHAHFEMLNEHYRTRWLDRFDALIEWK